MSVQEHQIIKLRIEDLVFDPTNPNIMSEEQMQGLRKSMKRFGYLTPVVVDQENKIADGEHRALIYKELGITEIPAIKMKLETDADRRQLRQVLNKLHGFHDKQRDADELVHIFKAQKLDELAELIAQPREELQRAMVRYHPGLGFITPENEHDIDQLIDDELKRIVPDSKLADVYQLGNHRIICADATDDRSIKALLQDDQIDTIITDPPYSSGGWQEAGRVGTSSKGTTAKDEKNIKIERDGLSTRGYISLIKEALTNIHADVLYLFTDWRMWSWTYDSAEACGYPVKNMIVWDKMYEGMGFPWRAQHELILYARKTPGKMTPSINHGNVIQCERTGNINHATEKPVKLLNLLIENTEDAKTFYDPFLGSGSTLIACEQTNRTCYGIEIDPRYVDICIKRWEKYTGKQAVKLN